MDNGNVLTTPSLLPIRTAPCGGLINKGGFMFFKEKKKPTFKDGDKRVVTKFCWLPTYVLNGWAWLETVTIEQEAFNMYYETNHWVQWTTKKRIDT